MSITVSMFGLPEIRKSYLAAAYQIGDRNLKLASAGPLIQTGRLAIPETGGSTTRAIYPFQETFNTNC